MNSPMSIDVARSILARPEVAGTSTNLNRIVNIYRVVLGRTPKPKEIETAYDFIGKELREEGRVVAAAKDMVEKAAKKTAERAKRLGQMGNNGLSAIQNEGEMVERKPLTAWETYAHALLLSNEMAYVN
jgi:citrate lyase beta subunit